MLKKNKVYIIAEIGNNHNGNLALAKKSIKSAAQSGADAVKFQSYITDEFMADQSIKYTYKTEQGNITENMYKMFKKLEFKDEWYSILSQYCKKLKIDFLSSAAHIQAAKILKKIGSKAIKIASEDIVNYPLLEMISKLNKRVILSTGMADQTEIDKAVLVLKKIKHKLILLHCVSLYPTLEKEVNLNRITALKKRYKLPIGFSDHTLGIKASVASIALGACMIEKHFTYSKKLKGPDHYLSLDPKEFKKMVIEIRRAERMMGKIKIYPNKREIKIGRKHRRSIVANQMIEKGTKITKRMVKLKRPGTGLHPIYMDRLIGKKSKKKYYKDQQIKF